ncbi:hypothetical protein, partial [Yersinia pestis]|uniref:hypothetical protein n=1 Tax=Yersinia pestis TaxID=632 RepID=UPI001C1F3DA1
IVVESVKTPRQSWRFLLLEYTIVGIIVHGEGKNIELTNIFVSIPKIIRVSGRRQLREPLGAYTDK